MTASLTFYAILGVLSTVFAFACNRHLFARGDIGRVSALEGVYYFVGVASLCLGWYFNVRYVHTYGHRASYINYTKMLFTNWASDSAAQDYTIVNVVLLPLWTIVDGRRRGLRVPVDLLRDEPLHQSGVLQWRCTWRSSSDRSATSGSARRRPGRRSHSCTRE